MLASMEFQHYVTKLLGSNYNVLNRILQGHPIMLTMDKPLVPWFFRCYGNGILDGRCCWPIGMLLPVV